MEISLLPVAPKLPTGDHTGLFYLPYQVKVLFKSAVIIMGWHSAQLFHNMENTKTATKPGQPYTTDTIDTQAGNGVNFLYIW